MPSLLRPFAILAALSLTGSGILRSAESRSGQKRSFRPIVPIAHHVPGGTDRSAGRTVSFAIPPPPIPEASGDPADGGGISRDAESSVEDAESPRATGTIAGEDPGGAGDAPPSDRNPSDESVGSEGAADPENPLPAESAGGAPETAPDGDPPSDAPTLSLLRAEAHKLASLGLTYTFGADDPERGGMDCSATIQHLLTSIGIEGVPRTSYDQYYWLRRQKLLDDVHGRGAEKRLFRKLSPGDLIFWGGTWKSGHRVSHVMLYLGYDPESDKHYVFGARGRSSTGMLGNGVDIFELDPNRGRLIAHGKIPGLVYD